MNPFKYNISLLFVIAFTLSDNANSTKMGNMNHNQNRINNDEYSPKLHTQIKPLVKGNVRYDSETGFPAAFYKVNYQSFGETPEATADHFIRHNKEMLGIESGDDLTDLRHFKTQKTPAGYTVRYHQIYQNVTVYRSDLAISFNEKNEVNFVMSSYKKGIVLETNSTIPRYNKKEALAKTHFKVEMDLNYEDAKLTIVYQKKGYSHLAWQMDGQNSVNMDEMEVLLNANDGSMIKIRDRFHDKIENKIRNNYDKKQSGKSRSKNVNESEKVRETSRMNNYLRKSENELQREAQVTEILQPAAEGVVSAFQQFIESIASRLTSMRWTSIRFLKLTLHVLEVSSVWLVQSFYEFISNAGPILFPGYFPPPTTSTPTHSHKPSNQPAPWPTFYPSVSNKPSSTFSPSISPSVATFGFGYVFDPDPITSAGLSKKYGDQGMTDNNDRDTPQLEDQLTLVTLNNIQFKNGLYSLKGRYADIIDVERPFKGLFRQRSSDFLFNRQLDGFEAVNCYYHIDKIMRYVNEVLKIPCRPYLYEGGVRVDPHGLSGSENSHYIPRGQYLAYGEGGVDDAEDPDVIIHELAHGFHDWLTAGKISIEEGLAEGFGDYIAASYRRSSALKFLGPNNPDLHKIMRWDGHNDFWGGRVTNYDKIYPAGLINDIHTDGQIWSSCNMKVWDAIGKEKSDKAHLIGISMLNSLSTQLDAAHAVLQAAENLGYSNEEIQIIRDIYIDCGYDVTDDICGDGIRGRFEICDGDDINGATCENRSCKGGVPTCSLTCELDFSPCLASENQWSYSVFIRTDDFFTETSWDLKNSSGAVINQAGPFFEHTSYTEHGCVEKEECYKFTIYDTFADGFCCEYGNGEYNLFFNGTEIEGTDPIFEYYQVPHYFGNC